MQHTPFPGYENQFKAQLRGDTPELNEARKANGAALVAFEKPEGMKVEDKMIPGPDEGQELHIRIFTPAGLPEKAPAVLDIHGGAWVAGNLDIDNARCAAIAVRVPCVVVTVEYRLSGTPEVHYPMPLEDCYTAYKWILDNGDYLGTNGKIGLHGSSSGGNLAAGLALYLRDRNEHQPELTVLNCPCTSNGFNEDYSYHQNFELRMGPDAKAIGAENAYLGGYFEGLGGKMPSHYAFPLYANDVGMLGPHFVLVGEYDTLRDDGLKYAWRLLKAGVPTEIMLGARSCHCWTAVPGVYTDLTHDSIALSYQREFGLLDHLKK